MRTLLAVAIVLLAPALPSAAAVRVGAAPSELVFSSTFSGDREIFTASADGSNRVDMTRDPHADITPSWSADGRRIAFASNRSGAFEIYVMNADGSNVVQVTHDNAYADDPRFTGYDKAIVYESNKGGNWEIRRIGVDGSNEVDLTRNRAADRDPATSPRGAIAFTSDRGGAGEHIWVMRWNGVRPRQLTRRPGGQSQPAWDPSGSRLAFVAGSPGSGTSVWSVLANGKRLRRLTPANDRTELSPSWSPDGSSLVFQDCPSGAVASCTLMTMALGSAPVDISTLRAPFVDTFDGGDGRFWQVIQFGSGAVNTEENGRLVTTLPRTPRRAASTIRSRRTGAPSAGWSATSTFRSITSCSSGRRRTASRRLSRPSPAPRTSGSWRSGRARSGVSSTVRGSHRTFPRFPPPTPPGACASSARETPR